MSETFNEVKADWKWISYKEKVLTICHLQDTLLGLIKPLKNPNELIFIAKELDDYQDKVGDSIPE